MRHACYNKWMPHARATAPFLTWKSWNEMSPKAIERWNRNWTIYPFHHDALEPFTTKSQFNVCENGVACCGTRPNSTLLLKICFFFFKWRRTQYFSSPGNYYNVDLMWFEQTQILVSESVMLLIREAFMFLQWVKKRAAGNRWAAECAGLCEMELPLQVDFPRSFQ